MSPVISQTTSNEDVTTITEAIESSLPWIAEAKAFLAEHAVDFGLRLLAALAILLVGRVMVSLLLSGVERAFKRARTDQMLVRFVQNVLKAILLIVLAMAALQTLGVALTSLTAILAAAGFAIGMALQGSLSNFAAGIMLVTIKPFRVGDYIDVAGIAGTVQEIRLFSCMLRTFDGVRITIPNGQITDGVIKNFSIEPQRMVNLTIGCSYNDELPKVKKLLQEILEARDDILDEPAPAVVVGDLGASSVNLLVRAWVENKDFWRVKCELTEQIKLAFDQHGFKFPYPSQDLYLQRDSGHETTPVIRA